MLRDFIARAEAYGIDYNIIEAFDQPWKTNEGGVGAVLGPVRRLAAGRSSPGPARSAIPTTGSSPASRCCSACCCRCRSWRRPRATAARGRRRWRSPPTRSAPGSRSCSPSGTAIISCPAPPSRFGLGIALLIPLVFIALARIEEIAAIAFGRSPRRLIAAPLPAPEGFAPKVSIHIPAYREPPEMLKATLDAVARLEYPEFRMRGRHQQHARSGLLAADRGALPHARRALQVRQCRQPDRLQGRRAAARARAHRRRCRDHRRHRRRLRGASRLAQGPGRRSSPIRRSAWSRRRRIIATASARSCITP